MIEQHAIERKNRLQHLNMVITDGQLEKVARQYRKGKHYVRVASIGKWVMLPDGSHGEYITVIVKDGIVKTLMVSEKMQRWNDGTFHVMMIK